MFRSCAQDILQYLGINSRVVVVSIVTPSPYIQAVKQLCIPASGLALRTHCVDLGPRPSISPLFGICDPVCPPVLSADHVPRYLVALACFFPYSDVADPLSWTLALVQGSFLYFVQHEVFWLKGFIRHLVIIYGFWGYRVTKSNHPEEMHIEH